MSLTSPLIDQAFALKIPPLPPSPSMSVIGSRVENRSGDCSLPVACWLGFRFAASIRAGVTPAEVQRLFTAEIIANYAVLRG